MIPYTLHGIPPHVLDSAEVEWWRNKDMQVGEITKQVRPVRVINTLTGSTTLIEVNQINLRYNYILCLF
jgi:hypothetical protein